MGNGESCFGAGSGATPGLGSSDEGPRSAPLRLEPLSSSWPPWPPGLLVRSEAMIAALRGEKAASPPVTDGESEPPHWMEDEEIVDSSELLYVPDDTGWLVEAGQDEPALDEGGDLAVDAAPGVIGSWRARAPLTRPAAGRWGGSRPK